MIPKHKVLVYSALHTGTWFACGIVTEASKEEAGHRADWWVREVHDCTIESLGWPHGLTKGRMERLFESQQAAGYEFEPHIELAVLQAHQRAESELYDSLLRFKPLGIPLIIPMRDPLLSINTRVWRETGSLDKLHDEHPQLRKDRAADQFNSICRLLTLPEDRAYMLPIDLNYTEAERIQIFRDVIRHAGVTEGDTLEEQAVAWLPVNPTKNGSYSQQDQYTIEDEPFIDIKNAILDNNFNYVKEKLDIEVKAMQEILSGVVQRLKKLGYKDLCWW